jgi:hypothetical protein
MTVEPGWVPPGIDTSKANIARVYDYWLGGHHNFRADQDAARALITVEPNANPQQYWALVGVGRRSGEPDNT